ncbi:MAG: recombination mediator RecR [bacterium]|nr:recombination mediator RecR [bacterium]
MYPRLIQELIEVFSRFPGIGPRAGARFALYLTKVPGQEIDGLVSVLSRLKGEIGVCSFCFNLFDAKERDHGSQCAICRNPGRSTVFLCVVEKEEDVEAIEKSQVYKGRYFVLGGTVGTLRKKDIEKIRIKELADRVLKGTFQEIIIATNPTPEGEATALYVERSLEPLGVLLTRLARGIPIGGEIEYADEETLRNAFSGRHPQQKTGH